MKKSIPWLLVYLRIFLTLFAVLFGYLHIFGAPYIILMAVSAASDYYDGVLARKFGTETAALRQWDSIADTVFFIGVFVGMWIAYPAIFAAYAWGIFAVIGLEALRYVFDIAKFRRGASYHALSAKVFGVSLLVATIAIMEFGVAYPFLPIALFIGIVSELEGLFISFVLREWAYNIRHLGVAVQMRKGYEK